MAATYVTVAELRSVLGIGSLYSDAVLEEVCQTAEDLVDSFLWHNSVPVIAVSLTSNIATLALSSTTVFNVGQNVVIEGCGSPYNGNQTITAITPGTIWNPITWQGFSYPWSPNSNPLNNAGISYIQFAENHANDVTHLIRPYGKATGPDYVDYATIPAVNEASLMLAVDIWQARQAPGNGASSVDYGVPAPFKMGNSLMGRIRGLIAPYMNPGAMVG